MGKVLSIATKSIRNFNIESRAHKVISKDKPTPAPRYPADEFNLQQIVKEHPDSYKKLIKKDENLDTYLKDVFITSQDSLPKQNINPNRPLPLDRKTVEDFEFGVKEPDRVPEGKVTLQTALQFITNHQASPGTCTIESISKTHKIPDATLRNIFHYFKVFEVYIPQDAKGAPKANFMGPAVPRTQIVIQNKKSLKEPPREDVKHIEKKT